MHQVFHFPDFVIPLWSRVEKFGEKRVRTHSLIRRERRMNGAPGLIAAQFSLGEPVGGKLKPRSLLAYCAYTMACSA